MPLQFDYNEIEKKFKELPQHIQFALSSTELSDQVKAIGESHGLLLDQESVLYDLIGYVILGLVAPADFVNILAKEANLDMKKAVEITKDLNEKIISVIRKGEEEAEETEAPVESVDQDVVEEAEEVPNIKPDQNTLSPQSPQPIRPVQAVSSGVKERPINLIEKDYSKQAVKSDTKPEEQNKMVGNIEKAGNFTVEKTVSHDIGHVAEEKVVSNQKVVEANGVSFEKSHVEEVEETHLPNVIARPINVEPLPDQLLRGAVSNVETKKVDTINNVSIPKINTNMPPVVPPTTPVVKESNTVSIPPKYEKKSYTTDPYRESVE